MAQIILPPENGYIDPDINVPDIDEIIGRRPKTDYPKPARPDRLQANEVLRCGQELTVADGSVKLCFQNDSNFVLYQGGSVKWVYRPWNRGRGERMKMQPDGNLVIKDSNSDDYGSVVWATNTYKETNGRPATLVLKDNGTAVIEDESGRVVWGTVSYG